jgi:hypothetical protein
MSTGPPPPDGFKCSHLVNLGLYLLFQSTSKASPRAVFKVIAPPPIHLSPDALYIAERAASYPCPPKTPLLSAIHFLI